MRDTKRVFAAREFEGAPKTDGQKHTFLVLDGQQRLTSLYQAFFGVGEHRYYLDLRKLLEGEDFEEAIFHRRTATKWVQACEDFRVQAEELILPLSVLKNGAGGFLQWLLQATNPLPSEERTKTIDRLTKINQQWIQVIDDYHFPVVTLSDKTESDALCTIFETLNRTGVKLSVFELLTARFWSDDLRLRDLWDEGRAKNPVIEDFDIDPYYVLQGIALAARRAPSCKRGDVLNLASGDVRDWWPKVISGLATGLEILRDDCKVALPKWLPYQTMVIPLSAVLARMGISRTPEVGAHREKLKRWFWCSVFGQSYESSPNSQSARDIVELEEWLSGGKPPEIVENFRFDPKALRDITPRQRSIYRGTICLVLGSGTGARDFHTQAAITGKLMIESGIDDHHVFPASYLEKEKGIRTSRVRDCVLNRTLIDRTTNQMINDRAPSVYFADIRDTDGFPFDDVLASHCLPTGEDSPFFTNDFDAFLSWRERRLWQEIKRVTGVVETTILEVEKAGME